MFQDLRQLARAIGRAKTSAIVLLLSLALGTGANAAVYGAIHALLRRGPAGVGEPSRLVSIYTSQFSGTLEGPSSYPDYEFVKSHARTLASVSAVDDHAVRNVDVGGWSRSARIAAVTEEFFATLQMRAHEGWLPTSADDGRDGRAAVVSFALSEQLGGSAQTLDKTLTIGDTHYVIIGVAPPRFRGLRAGRECDVWIPVSAGESRGHRRLSVIARLGPGFDVQSASQELRRISADLAVRFPRTNRGHIGDSSAPRRISAARYSQLEGAASANLFLLAVIVSGAAVLLLSSACLNVASLHISRGVARRRELAVKIALGATRTRLVRQLLTESLCIALIGGGLGLLLAHWTAGVLPALFITEQAELLENRLEPFTVLLTIGITCLAGALFGLAPALTATASRAQSVLRGDPAAISDVPQGRRLRALVVGAQIALSTVLLLGTGLLVAALTRALEGDRESGVKNAAFVSLELPGRYAQPSRGIARRETLLESSRSIEGFEAVGWASNLPLERGNRRHFRIEANTPDVVDSIEVDTNIVSSGYFGAMGLKCIEGTLFDEQDGALPDASVVVDETLARRYFGQVAVEQHLIDDRGVRTRIIGVVQSGRYRALQGPPQPTVYYPLTHDYLPRGHLVVRTTGDPEAMLPTMISVVRDTAGGADILQVSTFRAYLADVLMLDRVATVLVGVCGLIALALATIGVYGVISDAVQRRTREIGLRVALGATPVRVVTLVVWEALYLTTAGLVTGVTLAVAGGYAAGSVIEALPPLDRGTLVSTLTALALAMGIAMIPPMRHALAIQPIVALRDE